MRRLPSLLVIAVLPVSGCSLEDGIGTGPIPDDQLVCDLDPAYLADGGVGRDGIPALSDPLLVPISPVVPANAYVRDEDRVIAVRVGPEWIVIPHNIMWQHEIVNFNGGLSRMSVTYCPLTGTALAFDRTAAGGAEFAVSGLLYQANLIMYDRNEPEESFWPQMLGEARCGPRSGARLSRLPVVEMTMGGWKELHPDSKMVGVSGGLNDWRLYVRNPYGDGYDDPHNADFQDYPIPLDDDRLPPKERVLGLPADGSGASPVAFSFAEMGQSGDHAVFGIEYGGAPGNGHMGRTPAGGHGLSFGSRREPDDLPRHSRGRCGRAHGNHLGGRRDPCCGDTRRNRPAVAARGRCLRRFLGRVGGVPPGDGAAAHPLAVHGLPVIHGLLQPAPSRSPPPS